MLLPHAETVRPPSVTLERRHEPLSEPDFVADAPPERFAAFWGACRAYGWVRLPVPRLTDLLNAHAELTLRNAQVEDLAGGGTEACDELRLVRDELVAVQATGRSGDPGRRRRSRLHPIAAQSGPYLLAGFLHAAPGVSPTDDLAARPAMVPLTDAWLEFWIGGRPRRQWVGTMIFNRHRAEWIEMLAERDGELDRPAWRANGAGLEGRSP